MQNGSMKNCNHGRITDGVIYVANEQNLIPFSERSEKEQRDIRSKGGKASVKVRREKKTVQAILNAYLDQRVRSNPNYAELADALGIKGNQTLKELVTAACIQNTVQKGDVDKLLTICEILGENNETEHLEDISEAEEDIFGSNED